MIGIVHPLDLTGTPGQDSSTSNSLDAWRSHLARFKVKPPFPQIDRPVELLDSLHGNRREYHSRGKKTQCRHFPLPRRKARMDTRFGGR